MHKMSDVPEPSDTLDHTMSEDAHEETLEDSIVRDDHHHAVLSPDGLDPRTPDLPHRLEIPRTTSAPIAINRATPNWIVLSLRYPPRTGNATFVTKQATSRESALTKTKPDVHLPDRHS